MLTVEIDEISHLVAEGAVDFAFLEPALGWYMDRCRLCMCVTQSHVTSAIGDMWVLAIIQLFLHL